MTDKYETIVKQEIMNADPRKSKQIAAISNRVSRIAELRKSQMLVSAADPISGRTSRNFGRVNYNIAQVSGRISTNHTDLVEKIRRMNNGGS